MGEVKLELQTDVIGQQSNMSPSICDRFGINMYSDEFLAREKIVLQMQGESRDSILLQVLSQNEINNVDSIFKTVVSSEETTVQRNEYDLTDGNNGTMSMIFFGVMGVLVASVILLYIENKRGKKKKNEDYYNDYKL